MEDAHSAKLSLERHPSSAYFGIFDGHSGSLCSNYIGERLVTEIDKLETFDLDSLSKTCLRVDQEFLDEYVFSVLF